MLKTKDNVFFAVDPATNKNLEGSFYNATHEEVDQVVKQATTAFKNLRKKDKNDIADFLDCAADEILNLGNVLLERCHLETALPLARLQGERGRTVNQLKLFASVVREGSWVDARIDLADSDRQPLPKPDIRQMLLPIGPVAIFGASNFPLAFSVAGGDTASALAAGCPVVVKAHPAHPGTSDLVAGAILRAAEKCGMPDGTFAMIHGNTHFVGQSLVKHPGIKAVGFTGSFNGGKALFDLANTREAPIPVFAEMGSINPVFILPEMMAISGKKLSANLMNSIALGTGQFCTNPGLVIVQESSSADEFYNYLKADGENVAAGTMLTSGIAKAYENGLEKISKTIGVELLASGLAGVATNTGEVKVFKTSVQNFENNKALSEENFGPSSILVEAISKDDILAAAHKLDGHLTATVHGTATDLEQYEDLLSILEDKVGRIIINGYPTGVEVCHAMVHGGPFPATTAPQSTSVGSNAIKRFVRPVCFQDFPDSLLPEALKNDNKLDIWRLVDGKLTKSSI